MSVLQGSADTRAAAAAATRYDRDNTHIFLYRCQVCNHHETKTSCLGAKMMTGMMVMTTQ